MAAIDVGAACSDRSADTDGPRTLIQQDNPANLTGTIDQVKVWATINMTDTEFASFIDEGSANFSTNGDTNGSNITVTAGACRTFTAGVHFTAFAISQNELLGAWWALGNIERGAGGGGYNRLGTDEIPASSVNFPLFAGGIVSMLGSGEEAVGGIVPILDHHYRMMRNQ